MEALVWSGAALSLVGLAGLVWCILLALRAKRAQLPDDEMRARLARIIPLNLGALLLSALGLMLVAVGVILG